MMCTSFGYAQYITKSTNQNKPKDSTSFNISSLDIITNNINSVNRVSHLGCNKVSTLKQTDKDWSKWKDCDIEIIVDETKKTLKISNIPNIAIKYEGFKEFVDENNGGLYLPTLAKDQFNRQLKIYFHITNEKGTLYVVLPDISYRYELLSNKI